VFFPDRLSRSTGISCSLGTVSEISVEKGLSFLTGQKGPRTPGAAKPIPNVSIILCYGSGQSKYMFQNLLPLFSKKGAQKTPAAEKSPKLFTRSLKERNSTDSVYNNTSRKEESVSDSLSFRAFPRSQFRAAIFRMPGSPSQPHFLTFSSRVIVPRHPGDGSGSGGEGVLSFVGGGVRGVSRRKSGSRSFGPKTGPKWVQLRSQI